MPATAELRVHVVVLWQGDVVHTALLAPGETFVLGDGRKAWPCPVSALCGARSHVLVQVGPASARVLPPGGQPQLLACGRHASVKLEHLSILVSAGVVDRHVRHFRTTRWDLRLITATALTAFAHFALLLLCAWSLPPLESTSPLDSDPEAAPPRMWVRLESAQEPELFVRTPDVAAEPSEWPYAIAGNTRCGDAFDMGTPTHESDGRYMIAGPRDNADPHVARHNGPARPGTEEQPELPPTLRLEPPPDEQRDPDALTAAWGRDTPLGVDPISVRAQLWGEAPTAANGRGLDGKIDARGGDAKLVRVSTSEPRTRRRPARVVHAGLRVSGARDASGVSDTMLTALTSFRACYAANAAIAARAGRVELTFAVDPDGSVSRSSAADTGGVEPLVMSCMLDAIRALRFGAALAETTVSYPLLLIPGAPLEVL